MNKTLLKSCLVLKATVLLKKKCLKTEFLEKISFESLSKLMH
jgi:hypothetical protein